MGGYGSGRHGNRPKVEDYRSLDLYKMKRVGCLEEGYRGNWIWTSDGEEVARIGIRCVNAELRLSYSVRLYGGDWEPIAQTIPLVQLACNYGGHRTYGQCPGVVAGRPCGRRVGKLYGGGRYFLCRHCYGLAYACQSEAPHYRLLRRANKLRAQLNGFDWYTQKPKGMWWRTFDRKLKHIGSLDELAELTFIEQLKMRTGQTID